MSIGSWRERDWRIEEIGAGVVSILEGGISNTSVSGRGKYRPIRRYTLSSPSTKAAISLPVPRIHKTQISAMTHQKSALLLFILIGMLASCKKEKEDDFAPIGSHATLPISMFSHLEPGNYWIYERRQVDSMDVPLNTIVDIDSLFVTGDTLLNGLTYAVISKARNGILSPQKQCWRDSADRIVTAAHEIIFCSATFNQVIYTQDQGILRTDYSVSSAMVPLSVPAGDFSAFVMLGQCTSIGSYPVVPEWKYPRTYWAYGVGRMKWHEHYMSSPLGYRYELLRYHVE